jgi:CHASE1-domain containing sensor protein
MITIKADKFQRAKITLEMPQNLHQWQTISHLPLSAAEETQRTQAQSSGVVFFSGTQYLNKDSKVQKFQAS